MGGINSINVDVRIIAATNRDLESEVKTGRFRDDLYYRLNVVPIRLPALRERKDDIDLLVKFFLQQFNVKLAKAVTSIEPIVLDELRDFPWPGNIRQLENVLERMVLMSDDSLLRVADLPEDIAQQANLVIPAAVSSTSESASFKEIVRKQTQHLERELIEKALEETNGNITRAAEKLGLSRKGLQLKMKELGLKRPID